MILGARKGAIVAACLVTACFVVAGCAGGSSRGSADLENRNDASVFVDTATDPVSDQQAEERGPAVVDSPEVREDLRSALADTIVRYAGSYAVACVSVDGSWEATLNADEPYVSASMIKLAILGAFLDQSAQGAYDLDASVSLPAADIVGGTGVIGSYGAGSRWTYRELLGYMIEYSDNTATNALIDVMGIQAVNDWAASFGLEQTKLNRKMLDPSTSVENYMSANDIAKVMKAIWSGTFVDQEMSSFALSLLEGQTDSTGLCEGLPAGLSFAHKTGLLDSVRNDGGIVESESPYVLVVLSNGVNVRSAETCMAEVAQVVNGYVQSW